VILFFYVVIIPVHEIINGLIIDFKLRVSSLLKQSDSHLFVGNQDLYSSLLNKNNDYNHTTKWTEKLTILIK